MAMLSQTKLNPKYHDLANPRFKVDSQQTQQFNKCSGFNPESQKGV
jgi:hypothetical protein